MTDQPTNPNGFALIVGYKSVRPTRLPRRRMARLARRITVDASHRQEIDLLTDDLTMVDVQLESSDVVSFFGVPKDEEVVMEPTLDGNGGFYMLCSAMSGGSISHCGFTANYRVLLLLPNTIYITDVKHNKLCQLQATNLVVKEGCFIGNRMCELQSDILAYVGVDDFVYFVNLDHHYKKVIQPADQEISKIPVKESVTTIASFEDQLWIFDDSNSSVTIVSSPTFKKAKVTFEKSSSQPQASPIASTPMHCILSTTHIIQLTSLDSTTDQYRAFTLSGNRLYHTDTFTHRHARQSPTSSIRASRLSDRLAVVVASSRDAGTPAVVMWHRSTLHDITPQANAGHCHAAVWLPLAKRPSCNREAIIAGVSEDHTNYAHVIKITFN